ncbi:hypothetical protein EXN66_Car020423 [Channa argus]|uniref:Uncharacterized protein n=1 Tax=Channa argus TaxID=215402 RepID=A0A6G1QR10_CHAAH|nr:hypothetical protein EXN66_Car020423 [Channa argus]
MEIYPNKVSPPWLRTMAVALQWLNNYTWILITNSSYNRKHQKMKLVGAYVMDEMLPISSTDSPSLRLYAFIKVIQ